MRTYLQVRQPDVVLPLLMFRCFKDMAQIVLEYFVLSLPILTSYVEVGRRTVPISKDISEEASHNNYLRLFLNNDSRFPSGVDASRHAIIAYKCT